MTLSTEARTLWSAAIDLGRDAARVSPAGRPIPPLWFLTDPDRTPEPWRTAARLPVGAGVILRHFGRPQAEEWARRLRAATAEAGVRLLVAADPELARVVEADGVHLPERLIEEAPAVRAQNPRAFISAACHDAAALRRAESAGVDMALVSPVFPPGGGSTGAPIGVSGLTVLARSIRLPVVALGGLAPENVGRLKESGVSGIAGVDAFQRAFSAD